MNTAENLDRIEYLSIDSLIPYARNSRTHSPEQIAQLAASIREFGFTNPILIDGQDGIIAGHGRVMAAKQCGMVEVKCIRLAHLTDVQKRAYIIADNKLSINSGWDENMLAAELEIIEDEGFDLFAAGFTDEELGIDPEEDPPSREHGVREIPVHAVRATFWISVRGPLEHQADALQRLQEVMKEMPVDVELGTSANEQLG